MRDLDALRSFAARLTSELGKHGTRPTRASGEALAGYLDVLDGRKEIGLDRLKCALSDTRLADHAPGMRAVALRLLLEALGVAGDARTGLATADWALALGDGDRLWEGEFRRLRAVFLSALGSRGDEVESELARALEVARRQGALLFELRAAASLLRHRLADDSGGDVVGARARLKAIADRFVEGHETPDLRDAAALLFQG
jgi:hypothetical protein